MNNRSMSFFSGFVLVLFIVNETFKWFKFRGKKCVLIYYWCIVLHQNFHRNRFALSGIGKKSICCLYFHYNFEFTFQDSSVARKKIKKNRIFAFLFIPLLVCWLDG